MKKGLLVFVIIAVIVLVIFLFKGKDNQVNSIMEGSILEQNEGSSVAVFDTSMGFFEVQLYTKTMPVTAGNFETLIANGFYDGMRFHRVIPGFMNQAGDPNSKDESKMDIWGTGGPGYAIDDEFVDGHSNLRGTLSMANSGPNTGGSQFFVNVADNTFLNWFDTATPSSHPVFGEIISGMDIVDVINGVETTGQPFDRPLEGVVINSVTIK